MPIYRLPDMGLSFPDPSQAEPDGLLAIGGCLNPLRVVAAYCAGIFPWYQEDTPPLWWSPDPRCVLLPDEFHMPRSLARMVRAGAFTFTIDKVFTEVINGCAAPRKGQDGTWLIPEVINAYTTLHGLGITHSVEAWRNGELAGGLYGLSLGNVFFGESMFFRYPNASKAAFAYLVKQLREANFTMIDCQQDTANLRRFGARCISRAEFMSRLAEGLSSTILPGSWQSGVPREQGHA